MVYQSSFLDSIDLAWDPAGGDSSARWRPARD
jgi:hypothetical protein